MRGRNLTHAAVWYYTYSIIIDIKGNSGLFPYQEKGFIDIQEVT